MTASPAGPTAQELEALIDRYTDNLLRAALSMGFSETDAEELVQATFAAYLDGGSRFQKRSQILTYLFGILYNKMREARRFRDRHDSIDAAGDAAFDRCFDVEEHWSEPSMRAMTEVEDQVQTQAIGQLLQECLDGLGALMRMVFTLKEVEGRSSAEICMALDIAPSNLGVLLFRARNKLRDCLTQKGAVLL